MKTAAAEVAASTVAALSSDARQETQRPACGSGDRTRSYNTGLHVFALFLILFLSILACSFPIAARRFPKLPVPHRALFLSRHFGTGVLLATAFVHLLPTAYVSLTDPCLPPFWNEGYPAMAGFIAMVSVFVVVGVEMFFASKGAGHSHGGDYSAVGADEAAPRRVNGNGGAKKRPGAVRGDSLRYFQQGTIGAESREHLTAESGKHGSDIEMSNRKRDAHGEDNGDESDLDLDELDPQSEGAQYADTSARDRGADYGHARVHSSGGLSEEAQQQKALLQCMLLEAGILFHSVFIGMAVSVATGTGFIVLLIAISFHQTFEGLALGSRIAGITAFPPGSPKPWLMALAYGTTTPLGQAIGLFVHNLYDPQSQMGLLMVGVMNAISSGLLLFAGLVELLAEDFLSDKSYETLRGARRLEACAAVVAGSMLMALVGAWA
ncbi:hypothetical protein MBLNU457_7705t1 [Dothideomycetes sp. NU457]